MGVAFGTGVRFAPDPTRRSHPTQPAFVETRLVRDLTELPLGATLIVFDSVVEVDVDAPVRRLEGGPGQTLRTPPFDELLFFVVHDAEQASNLRRNGRVEVDVHPSLKGTIWVFAESVYALTQQAA